MCEGLGSGRACGGWLLHYECVRDVMDARCVVVLYTVPAGCCRLFGCRSELKVGMCWCWMGELNECSLLSLQAAAPIFPPRAGSARLVVIPPGVLRVEYGVARGATRAVSFRHVITAIYIHVLILTSTKASPPPHH